MGMQIIYHIVTNLKIIFVNICILTVAVDSIQCDMKGKE